MHLEIKKTFYEIVDDEEKESRVLRRRLSAPAILPGTVPTLMNLKPHDLVLKNEPSTPSTCSEWSEEEDEHATTQMTTVILRNIPPSYTRSSLLDLLDGEGFACLYDFVYLPIKLKNNKAFGYAFINMLTHSVAQRFLEHFANFDRWGVPHSKCAEVDLVEGEQGFEAQVQRYRDSAMMQVSSPDEMKPIILKAGVRIPFPEPTKVLAEPKSNSRGDQTPGHSFGGSCGFQKFSFPSAHPPSWPSEAGQEHGSRRASKRNERAVKRIKGKLVKLGHNPNM